MIQVEGYDELKRQLKKLKDAPKRREILKIQRQVAKPLVEKSKLTAPEGPTGNLVDSIGTVTGRNKKNPNTYVTARVKRGNKGHHAHLVHEGTVDRKKKNGRSTGTMPANPFLQRAFDATETGLVMNYEKELGRYFKRAIKRLSN